MAKNIILAVLTAIFVSSSEAGLRKTVFTGERYDFMLNCVCQTVVEKAQVVEVRGGERFLVIPGHLVFAVEENGRLEYHVVNIPRKLCILGIGKGEFKGATPFDRVVSSGADGDGYWRWIEALAKNLSERIESGELKHIYRKGTVCWLFGKRGFDAALTKDLRGVL